MSVLIGSLFTRRVVVRVLHESITSIRNFCDRILIVRKMLIRISRCAGALLGEVVNGC